MTPEKRKKYKAAIKVSASTFAVMDKGIVSLERRIKPIVGTYSFIGSAAAETEILGYVQTLVFTADRVTGDNANDYIYSLICQTGTNCETDVFVYCENDTGTAPGSYSGKTYRAAIAVNSLSGDDYLSFGGTIYLNGNGATEEKVL